MEPELLKMMLDFAAKHPKAFAHLMATSQNNNGRPNWTPLSDPSPLDVLTLAEAAAYLSLPEVEVRAEAEAGKLVGHPVGDDWRFVREDVLKWVRSPRPKAALRPELEETEEEFEAFLAVLRANRDEVDRATKSGKYAEDE